MLMVAVSLFAADADAQRRMNYPELAARSRNPLLYLDQNILPPKADGPARLAMAFKIGYEHLAFRKADDQTYFSNAEISIEIFDGEPDRRGRELSVEGLEPVKREFWKHKAVAETYEQTRAAHRFLSGSIQFELEPGTYSYIVRMDVDGTRRNMGNTVRKLVIPDFSGSFNSQIYYLDEYYDDNSWPDKTARLIGMGQTVNFGKDFSALVLLPDSGDYTLAVDRMEVRSRDTTRVNTLYETDITDSMIRENISVRIVADTTALSFIFNPGEVKYRYALIAIPNSTFPNSSYRIIIRDENGRSQGERFFRNLWLDMPVSLLNLDLAIDMLRFIIDRDQLREMRRGSANEKERKFREFWDKRNPTPENEYNELMAEYYRRIDYAYENFSSPNTPGYDSDQGKTYITQGEPVRIRRSFPVNEPAREIWEYPDQTFVFVARTGFGDYELVGRQ
jgi:GWxTD domain-containing protein